MEIEVRFGFRTIYFVGDNCASGVKGKKLKEAGHVLNVTERCEIIVAKVMRQTSIHLPPYDVSITIDSNRHVKEAKCTCVAGLAGHCKHIFATVYAINEENSDSKTSGQCDWKKPLRSLREKYSKGKRFKEIFGVSSSKKSNEAFDPCVLSSDLFKNIKTPCMLRSLYEQSLISPKIPSTGDNQHIRLYSKHEYSDIMVDRFLKYDTSFFFIAQVCVFLFLFRILSDVIVSPLDMKFDIESIFNNQKKGMVLSKLYQYDISPLKKCCVETYNKLLPCEAVHVCKETLNNKAIWSKERQFRITASRAYALYTYSLGQWDEKSRKYFFPRKFTNKYVEHGLKNESTAREMYIKERKKHVQQLGLVVCQSNPWLAVSPDGVVYEHGKPVKLLEIKCPFNGGIKSAKEIEEFCPFLKREKGKLTLKKKNAYYAQTQLNMAVLNLKSCDFVVFCSYDKSSLVLNIDFDEVYVENMLFKLKSVYFQHMLHNLCSLLKQ